MKHLSISLVLCAFLGFAGPAAAALVTYDVDLNFDPTTTEGGSGVGTVTGAFTIDTSTNAITAIDLTEKTNTTDTIGGAFGSITDTSFTFTDLALTTAHSGQQADAFGGLPFIFVSTQSGCCEIDGVQVGPFVQFDFPSQGGAVHPGNFDSVTSENRFLYGDVTPAPDVSAAPEPATWAMMLAGFAGLGFVGYRTKRKTGLAV